MNSLKNSALQTVLFAIPRCFARFTGVGDTWNLKFVFVHLSDNMEDNLDWEDNVMNEG